MIPFMAGMATAGAIAVVLVARHAVRRTAREDALWAGGWDAGRGEHAAELEALVVRHGNDLTVVDALDLADLGRTLKEKL